MDNQAFEMHPENPARSWKGKERLHKESVAGGRSLLKLFAVCLLAGLITTAVGMGCLSLIYTKLGGSVTEMRVKEMSVNEVIVNEGTEPSRPVADGRFRFLYRLSRSEPERYPGGEIRWATYRKNKKDYPDPEGMEFGESLYGQESQMNVALLKIKAGGLRVPHWHFNANEHGYVQQGKAWIGVVNDSDVTTYNASSGQVLFFPRNFIHWFKNVGGEELIVVLFYTTHQEVKTLEVDRAFYGTPEDVVVQALKPRGGLDFIRSFRKPTEDQKVNLPPNLDQLVHSVDYGQSEANQVWRYFYDLGGSPLFPFQGGAFQWAPYRSARTWLNPMNRIYIQSLQEHPSTLTLATLRISSKQLGQPHYHYNANELAYVLQGCGRAGLVTGGGEEVTSEVGVGDVVFFPVGSQHYLLSSCPDDLLLVLAYSTGNQELKTLRMKEYFRVTSDHILAQLFHKDQNEFRKFPLS